MMPVNMRGPVKLDRDTANQTGYLQISIPDGAEIGDVQDQLKLALRRRDHWASWAFLNISQIVGYAGIRHIFKFQMKRFQNRPFVGSFSNLGAWSGVGDWCICPLVTLTSPVGVGAIVCDGRLALTVEAHASIQREAGMDAVADGPLGRAAAICRLSDPRNGEARGIGSRLRRVAMPPTDNSEPLYPPFLAPPPEPLSLPGYFVASCAIRSAPLPAVVYREPIFQYRGRITYVTDPPLGQTHPARRVQRLSQDHRRALRFHAAARQGHPDRARRGMALAAPGRCAAVPACRDPALCADHDRSRREAPSPIGGGCRRARYASSIKTRRAPRSASSPRRCCTATIRP